MDPHGSPVSRTETGREAGWGAGWLRGAPASSIGLLPDGPLGTVIGFRFGNLDSVGLSQAGSGAG